ncbi:hypothetical protein KC345_g247 [Hortaea werneckii]|nr:hypothetical protein KC345_g247 [Hortaea werneckii]
MAIKVVFSAEGGLGFGDCLLPRRHLGGLLLTTAPDTGSHRSPKSYRDCCATPGGWSTVGTELFHPCHVSSSPSPSALSEPASKVHITLELQPSSGCPTGGVRPNGLLYSPTCSALLRLVGRTSGARKPQCQSHLEWFGYNRNAFEENHSTQSFSSSCAGDLRGLARDFICSESICFEDDTGPVGASTQSRAVGQNGRTIRWVISAPHGRPDVKVSSGVQTLAAAAKAADADASLEHPAIPRRWPGHFQVASKCQHL